MLPEGSGPTVGAAASQGTILVSENALEGELVADLPVNVSELKLVGSNGTSIGVS